MGSSRKDWIFIRKSASTNIIAPKYIKQILTNLKVAIVSNTTMVESCITPFSITHSIFGQKISKETVDLKNTIS
jgi:hypothetical protein